METIRRPTKDMNRKTFFIITIALLSSIFDSKVFAFDLAVNNSDGVTLYYDYIAKGEELEVTYGSTPYSGVVTIPDEVFLSNRTLKVTGIANQAFYYCYDLISVTLGNNITSIGNFSFCGCNNLARVSLGNNVETIGNDAFNGCSSLISFDIPESVTFIGDAAFYQCVNLLSITLPDKVSSIGDAAFYQCFSLLTLSIGTNVKSIGCSAFFECTALTTIDVPDNVKIIGNYAFYGCNKLSSLTIGKDVTSIGNNAFNGADIKTIVSKIEEPFRIAGNTSNNKIFSKETFCDAILYVPTGTINSYKTTEGWKDFVNIEEKSTCNVQNLILSKAKLISEDGGILKILGLDNGIIVKVYKIVGSHIVSVVSQDGMAVVNTNLRTGSVVIVRIGQESIKMAVK